MLNIRLKLKAKTLWIPLAITVMSYLIIGAVFSKMLIDSSHKDLHQKITKHIEVERDQLVTGLSLITSSQVPADAFLGLEGDDDVLAREIVKQVGSMGLDNVYFTNLNGSVIFPGTGTLSVDLSKVLKQSPKKTREANVIYLGGKMFGFAPIIDVETPKGFLVFQVNVPQELTDDAEWVFNNQSGDEVARQHKTASQHLAFIYSISYADNASFLKKMMITISSILLVTLVLLLVTLGKTSGNIICPIRDLLNAFRKLSEGDLTSVVHVSSHDEIAQLTGTFNETGVKLNAMLEKVTGHADNVAVSARQMFASSTDIAENARTQSDKTLHAISAMEELNSSYADVAKSSSTAAEHVREAALLAQEGVQVMTGTFEVMNNIAAAVNESAKKVEELGARSEQIGKIIQVIDGIAEQTNLLALNAAIEAARAGDNGRGFAVVADEVRGLAERTTVATNEITVMIRGIQNDTGNVVASMESGTKEVDEGVKMADRSREALKNIVASVDNVTDMVQRIAAAAEEQTRTTTDVAAIINDIDAIAARTAEEVSQSSELSRNLDVLSQELLRLVSDFTLRNGKDRGRNLSDRETGKSSLNAVKAWSNQGF